jgi:hypothetical protein
LGTRPSDYAEHLLEIVTGVRDYSMPSVALAMAHRKEFEGRMLAILDPDLRRRSPSPVQTASLVGSLGLIRAPRRCRGTGTARETGTGCLATPGRGRSRHL